MPHPSSIACTTAVPTGPATPQPPSPLPATKRRGNPNLALIPRCGARTRAGCPCRAPAIRGKLRCRMHGGRSTGPRTPEGRARVAAARTTHGSYDADARVSNRHHVTFLGRNRVRLGATVYSDRLPPDLAARMTLFAPELLWPPRPTRGITRAEDRAMLQAETAALAPWKAAIALARQAGRPSRAGPAAPRGPLTAAQARPLAPEPVAQAAATASPASPAVPPGAAPEPHAPIPPAPAQAAHHQVPGSTGAPAAVEPHAPERAARGVHSASPPARLAARPRAHAPERAAGAAATAPAEAPAAPASARAEPHAPIPPAAARNALDQAPASIRVDQAATPRATECSGSGVIDAPAPARPIARPKPHAPKRIPTPHTAGRTISPGRAARRWRRRQKLMHQNQAASPRS
jgi:hypothetical protein